MKTLNEVQPQNDGNYSDQLVDNSMIDVQASVSVFFRNQKNVLIEKIREYKCIVGCVAWLTDLNILEELSRVEVVSIVVQKEDFLRPDLDAPIDWKRILREAYGRLQNRTARFAWPG